MKHAVSGVALTAIVLWGCTAVTAFVSAQDDKARKEQTTAGEQLADDSLKQMLTGMGYEPKPLSKGFLLAIKQDTWTLNMQVVISANKEKIGLNANLGKVADPAAVGAADWLKLLVSNGDIEPSEFYFDNDQKKLYLHRVLDNRLITPAIMRKEIDQFALQIRQTSELWKFTK